MAGFSHDVAGGDGDLVVTALQSPNYVPGVSGWQVARNGDAEFNDVVVRGQFLGTDYELTTAGAFFYSAAPALGNLVASIAAAAGTDTYGNAYLAGIAVYDTAGQGTSIQLRAGNPAAVRIATGDPDESVPAVVGTAIAGSGPTRQLLTQVVSARISGQPAGAFSLLSFSAVSPDGSLSPQVQLQASDGTATTTLGLNAGVAALLVANNSVLIADGLTVITQPVNIQDDAPPAPPASGWTLYSSGGRLLAMNTAGASTQLAP